jgi:type IV secretory pathway VirB2 component (pilin)
MVKTLYIGQSAASSLSSPWNHWFQKMLEYESGSTTKRLLANNDRCKQP